MPYPGAMKSGIRVNSRRNGNAIRQASRFLSELEAEAPTQQTGIDIKPENLM